MDQDALVLSLSFNINVLYLRFNLVLFLEILPPCEPALPELITTALTRLATVNFKSNSTNIQLPIFGHIAIIC